MIHIPDNLSSLMNVRDIYAMLGGGGFSFSEAEGLKLPNSPIRVTGIFCDDVNGTPVAMVYGRMPLTENSLSKVIDYPLEKFTNKDIAFLRDVVMKYHSLSLNRGRNLDDICRVVLFADSPVTVLSRIEFKALSDEGDTLESRTFLAKYLFSDDFNHRVFIAAEPVNPSVPGQSQNFELGFLDDRTIHSIAEGLSAELKKDQKSGAKQGMTVEVKPAKETKKKSSVKILR